MKQLIIVRKDLKLRKGKMIAQGAHASMAVLTQRGSISEVNGQRVFSFALTPEMEAWLEGQFTKVCVSASSEEELLSLHRQAHEAGLPCSLIRDNALTELKEPTYTAVAIGPSTADRLDPITGKLPLL